jgi:hypothetical protein
MASINGAVDVIREHLRREESIVSMTRMSRRDVVERAQAIRGRCPLGRVVVSRRAYDELGAERCLELLQRYADQDGPDADRLRTATGALHCGYYEEDGEEYGFVSVPDRRRPERPTTYLGHLNELFYRFVEEG